MEHLIYFDLNHIVDSCIQRIDRISFFVRYLFSTSCKHDEFDNLIMIETSDGSPLFIDNKPLSESTLKTIEEDIKKWVTKKAYNDIISSFIILIDEILHAHSTLSELKNKKFEEINRNNTFLDLNDFIKKKFEEIRKKTLLEKKLKKLSSLGFFREDEIEILVSLYKSRNAIEHWDSLVNPISFKSIEEKYEVLLPIMKILTFDSSQHKWVTPNLIKKQNNKKINNKHDEARILIEFYKKTLQEGDEINITYSDIMCLVQWIVNVINEMRESIFEKNPPLTEDKLKEILEKAKKT